MRALALRAAALAALALVLATAPLRAEELIENFHADIRVEADGTVRVVETIQVRPEGREIRRGIYSDISTTFEDAEGRVGRVGFAIASLTRDGRPEPYHTERHSDFTRVYMGAEDVFLPVGKSTTYVLTYKTDRQVRWIDGRSELFWNVTGNAWAFPIRDASVRLRLPGEVAPLRWDAYTGRLGERGRAFRGAVENGELVVTTSGRLAPGEGLTIVAEIPAGAVTPPSAADAARYALRDNLAWLIGIAGMAVVLGYYLWAWNRVGRDPKGGTIIPLFHAPQGISPALALYVDRWGFGANAWQAFTAAALSLAVRGLLVFDQSGKDLVLERTDVPADDNRVSLPAGEGLILDWVEQRGGRAAIDKANGKAVAELGKAFRSAVQREGGNRYFRYNVLHIAIGCILSAAVVIAVVASGALTEDEIGLLFGFLFVGLFLGLLLVPVILRIFRARSAGQLVMGLVSGGLAVGFILFQAAGALPELAGESGIVSFITATVRDHPFVTTLVLLLPTLNGAFIMLLPAPTAEGRPIMDQLQGFRMYMETAESGRLNIADAPEITTERFEALLPYAVALGVEKPWANAFATALARANPGERDAMANYNARWRRGGSWSNANFGRSIASAVASASTAAASAVPRSSSGSSGFSGGSGGGGGGRGGGGW